MSSRLIAWVPLLAWLSLAVPSLWGFLFGPWAAYSQGHELLLLSVAAWLVWRQQGVPVSGAAGAALRSPAFWLGWGAGLLAYWLGRTQELIRIELLALWWLAMMVMLAGRGWHGLRRTWFAWLFCLFAMPLPFSVVLALTAPLKEAVSALAALILSGVGYPVGRSGVVLTVGQYQLLVAEACAGLHSMFILEAMGLLYSHLAAHGSRWRTLWLALLAIPVSFVANVMRVIILVLVTHHFGDAAGQGFVHHFAGLVLFAVALVLMAVVDFVLGLIWPDAPVPETSSVPAPAPAPAPLTAPGGGVRLVGANAVPSRAGTWVLGVSMVLVALMAGWGRLGVSESAQARAGVPLEFLFPAQVGDWTPDPVSSGLVRPAFEQARQFQMYDQVLERTYVHPSGRRLMLSVAYGRQQSVGLQMHRPEVCYRAGGFAVGEARQASLQLDGHVLPVTRLMARMPERPEPITYWRLLGDEVVADEAGFKLRQFAAGLVRRRVDDGLLVRVSSIHPDAEAGWRAQEAFVRDLARVLNPQQRLRVMGWVSAPNAPSAPSAISGTGEVSGPVR